VTITPDPTAWHWATSFDGEQVSDSCGCRLGRDHDEQEHHPDDCGDCQGSGQAFGNDALTCPCDCHPWNQSEPPTVNGEVL
jgi:hypothetical protein